jgi:hypothetical protein
VAAIIAFMPVNSDTVDSTPATFSIFHWKRSTAAATG